MIVAEEMEPTDKRGGTFVLQQIERLGRALAASANVAPASIANLVVGSPGAYDPRSGAINLVPNIPGLSDINVTGTLQTFLGCPAQVENDVNLAALGERWRGCAQSCENVAFLALGTGVGLGLIVNGQLVRGANNAAGEIAYLPIGADVRSLEALEFGAFEMDVGSAGILRHYRSIADEGAATVRDVFGKLVSGDNAARKVIDALGRTVAEAITAVHALLDPEVIVLGGSIGVRLELVDRIRDALPQLYARDVNLQSSALGPRAGIVGAIHHSIEQATRHLLKERS
jgi:predicted NBD/HSP70 family sugar kinase